MSRLRRDAGGGAARPQVHRRSTRQLDATLRALASSKEHPTAEQLFASVRRELPATSRGTVYRNLGKLVAVGHARIVHGNGRAARYDARLDVHDHFVCTRCTLVADVERHHQGGARHRSRVDGHRVDGRTLTYYGICRWCEDGMRRGRRNAHAAMPAARG